MKNVTLVCLNSRFSHTSLGIWYIKAYCSDCGASFKMLDTFVNRKTEDIVCDIVETKPDVVGLSTYIFNVAKTLEVAKCLRQKGIRVVLGGPEATYNKAIWKYADQVVVGEGEKAWKSILSGNEDFVIYGESVAEIVYPYCEEFFENAKNRTIYFEASRGCPYRCSYCMSAETKLIQFPLEKVQNELKKLKNRGIKLVKFVDRTFNANKRFAEKLIRFLSREFANEGIRFHFEVSPELFDDGLFDAIQKSPKGLLQFEIGYQSFCEEALEAVNRKTDLILAENNIRKLLSFKNCHIHTDLIVGLPFETYEKFKISFNRLFDVGAHQLQIGFLKVLKGSVLEANLSAGYDVNANPPYEFIKTPWLSVAEKEKLKRLEVAVDSVFNSHRFDRTIQFALQKLSPFELFFGLGDYIEDYAQLFKVFDDVKRFLLDNGFDKEAVCALLKFDYLSSNKSKVLPPSVEHRFNPSFKKMLSKADLSSNEWRFYEFEVNPITLEKKYSILAFSNNSADCITGKYDYRER